MPRYSMGVAQLEAQSSFQFLTYSSAIINMYVAGEELASGTMKPIQTSREPATKMELTVY